MPIARFQMPDGRVARFEVPEGTTPEQAQAAFQKQFAQAPHPVDPTDGMGTGERLMAGIGKAFVDTGRGVGQLARHAIEAVVPPDPAGKQKPSLADRLGLPTDADIAEARQLDAPLMATTAGKVGNFAGNVAVTAPTMLIPGVNTLKGAALLGAVQGGLQPTVGDESRLAHAATGAGAAAAGVVAARALLSAAQAGKALVEPFSQAGRDRIAGRTLQRFADDPSVIQGAAGGPTVTGATPTLAEATGDRGLAQLQDALSAADPQIANRIAQRLADNNAARVQSLRGLAGTQAQRDAAEAARQAATAPQYRAAFGQNVDVSPELSALLQRPSVSKALSRAAALAQEESRTPGLTMGADGAPAKITGQALQDLKLSMDALLKDPTSGIAGAEAGAVRSTRDAIVAEMERAIPEFQAARTGYAGLSKPLNGMDVAEQLANKATSNTSNLAGDQRLLANQLLAQLRDPQKLIRAATRRKELSSLGQVFEPDQLALVNAIAGEADRAAAVASAGNGAGSATAQRLASQNVLQQMIGPTGLPKSWAEGVLANTVIGKPANLLYGGVAEPKIQQALADAVLDPAVAQRVLQAAQASNVRLPDTLLTRLLLQGARSAPAAEAVSGKR